MTLKKNAAIWEEDLRELFIPVLSTHPCLGWVGVSYNLPSSSKSPYGVALLTFLPVTQCEKGTKLAEQGPAQPHPKGLVTPVSRA